MARRAKGQQATRQAGTGQATVRVRMYRQGLGDCLLLSLLRPDGKPFHTMFDCGVILGTPDAGSILDKVVADIAAETGGRVDVLVVTHEHYDHVAGFKLAADRFAPAGTSAAGKLSVDEVWYAWTEDPEDDKAKALREERRNRLRSLAQASAQLAPGVAEPVSAALEYALGSYGVQLDGKGVGDTEQAMAFPATLVGRDRVRYLRPGEMVTPTAGPELRVYVLGPPLDRASLMKTDSVPEVYRLDGLQPGAVQPDGGWRPFDAPWTAELSDLQGESPLPGALTEFLRERYFGPEEATPATDIAWRRIDGDWLAVTGQLALALDSATNNTSVALAIQVAATGDVLLFPADAQVGNWLSWHGLRWQAGGEEVTASKLLGRTVFYKVGHHGSGNATLKARGLELMTSGKLVAFVPVDQGMALKKRWGKMPLPSLMDELHARCEGRVVRIDDKAPPEGAGIRAGGNGGPYGALYYEWTMPV